MSLIRELVATLTRSTHCRASQYKGSLAISIFDDFTMLVDDDGPSQWELDVQQILRMYLYFIETDEKTI